MFVSKCPRNQKARLLEVPVEPRYRLRLQELGLRPGVEFTVVNRSAFGGVVLNVHGARVAVDARTAKKLLAEPIKTEPVEETTEATSSASAKTTLKPALA
ncbi:hypothetical protein BSR29_05775 [Boudabousia liubingyangii]|uniref:Ferrous iron transporter FeoA-like domain-containing protein n=1 Tax=Boudabousia liubingyangii TaxID=1921764 RepID=A0A1Q5PLU4_9ACTO|nr:FeoA family protein [Boudabousia liubingyangii]OKL47987.1 hypothetical protein BSR29_05775 [Boudabousia liubingyangii]